MTERQIFDAALKIADPAQRQTWLDRACAGDAVLRARLETLLVAHAAGSDFLNVPAVEQMEPFDPRITGQTSILPAGAFKDENAAQEDSDDGIAVPVDLSFLSPSLKPGSIGRLGHYEILQILGQGAFGIVFKAFDEKLQRLVAIKVINPQLAATSPPRKRFLREARSAAAVKHDNIVQVYSVEEQPLPYMVMEYVEGQTLQQKLDGSGPFEVPEILHLGRQMANGLAAAHALGLIHRDIKPGNILLEQGAEQRVKITDFGLARAADDASMTTTGMISGTPMYMAPEQAMGQTLDHRADLFSLGSVLYQMTSGRPPFRAPTAFAVLKRVADENPRPITDIIADVPVWLCEIISKLHAKKREDRFQSAKELAELLCECQTNPPQSSEVDPQQESQTSLDAELVVNPQAPNNAQRTPGLPIAEPQDYIKTAQPSRGRWLIASGIVGISVLVGLLANPFSRDPKLTESFNSKSEISNPSSNLQPTSGQSVQVAEAARFAEQRELAELILNLEGGRRLYVADPNTGTGWVANPSNANFKVPDTPISSVAELPETAFVICGLESGGADDHEVELILKCPELEHLSVWKSSVTDRSASRLAAHPRLSGLYLGFCKLTDRGVIELGSSRSIKVLVVGPGPITDVALPAIGAMDQLTHLSLYGTQISDDGLEYLKQLRSLKDLNIGQTRVTAAGVQRLKSILPSCNIQWNPPEGWQGWPADAPPPAIAPFDAKQAQQHQKAWADYLKLPVEYTNSIGMKFVLIPPGEFTMGSTRVEIEAQLEVASNSPYLSKDWLDRIKSEAPQHKVILTQAIYMGVHEVTQKEYGAVMQATPAYFTSTGPGKEAVVNLDTQNNPVESVSWNDAAEFCAKLSEYHDLKPFYFRTGETMTPLPGTGYKLPTEAEWEFACRAGTTTTFWIGDKNEDLIMAAWLGPNSRGRTHPVGKLKDNPLGLFDIHGNVEEWVDDWWEATYSGQSADIPEVNPIGTSEGSRRVLRGGSWASPASGSRSAGRLAVDPKARDHGFGFRVALTVAAVKDDRNDKHAAIGRSEAAKKLLEMGCVLRGFIGNERNDGIVQVPEQDFRVDGIVATETTVFRDEHVALFAQFPELEVFEGGTFEISAGGVQWLAKLPKLYKLAANSTRLDDKAVEQLRTLPSLTVISLTTTNLTPAGFAAIGHLTELQQLDLYGTNCDDNSLQYLKPLRKLERLSLSLTSVRGPGLQHLSQTQSLRTIDLDWQKVGNDGLAAVSQFKFIDALNLNEVTSITDEGLAHLKDMPRLRWLGLERTSITDAGLEHLSSLPALERLELQDTIVTDAGMKHLAELPRLHLLWLTNTRVGNLGLEYLKKVPITDLALCRTQVTDKGLASLKEFSQLERLSGIGPNSRITSVGINELVGLARLREFGMEGRDFDLNAWEQVGKFTNLISLNLSDTNINDEGLAKLTGMKNLDSLLLNRTDVTDQGLMQLKDLPKLRDVHCDAPKVTPAGVQALLNVLPSLRVQAASPDRGIAEAVLRLGGVVGIRQNGNEQEIRNLEQLPRESFELTEARLEGNPNVNDDNIAILKHATRLRRLNLGHTSVSDRGLEWIGNLTQLEYLCLWHSGITGKTVERMKPLTALKSLLLNGIVIGDEAFAALADAKQLVVLQAGEAGVTDASMPIIGQFHQLRDLTLGLSKITNKGFQFLAELNALETLSISGAGVSTGGATVIAKLESLRNLAIGDLQVSDASLMEPLKSLNALSELNLRGARFQPNATASLRLLKTLKGLYLEESDVRDADLVPIASLPSLESLNLNHTRISDEGLVHLEQAKSLKSLQLGDTKVTQAGIDKLHQALPQCRVEWDKGVVEPVATERDTAKRVIELGGYVAVVTADGEIGARRLDELPVAEFSVRVIELGGDKGNLHELLTQLKSLKKLEVLRLSQSTANDNDLPLIGELTELKELNLDECRDITDDGVRHLKGLTKLEELGLVRSHLTDEGLQHLEGMNELRILNLAGTQVSDTGLALIAKFRELQQLVLSDTRVGDDGIAKLTGLNIRLLHLGLTPMTDRAIDDILKFPKLENIQLGNKVTNAGVLKLLSAPHLRRQLHGFQVPDAPQITDEICDALSQCKVLGGVFLNGTSVSDAGLRTLSRMESLGEIWLLSTKVTAEGVKDFRKARPKCGVGWEPNPEARENK